MYYSRLQVICDPEFSEILMAEIAEAGFDTFMENEKGQVKEGYLADLVLFSHDLFEVKPEEIMSAKAVMTMVDGRIVYDDNSVVE